VRRMTNEEFVRRVGPPLERELRKIFAPLQEKLKSYERQATNFGKVLGRMEAEMPGGFDEEHMHATRTPAPGGGRKFGKFLKQIAGGHTKALQASDDSAGGALVPAEAIGDVIPRLIAESVVTQFRPVTTRLNGNTLRFPRIDGGATAQWIGEGENLPASQQTTGSVALTPKKLGVVVPISNDLIRRGASNVEAILVDDTVGSIDAAVDLAWIRGPGTSGQPTGFRNQPGVITTPSAGTSLTDVVSDLGRAREALREANVPMTRPGFLLSPRTERALFTALTSNGTPAFRDEMSQGRLLGVPFAVTSQIPVNLGVGGDESEVYLVDFAQVIVGEQVPVAVQAFEAAAYQDGGTIVSALSRDETVLRIIVETDIGLRHSQAVHVTTGVTWGT